MHEQTPLYYAESVLKLALRAGLLSEDEVLVMAEEHELLAQRNPHEAEVRRDTAHQLRATLIELDPPPQVDPAVQHRAEYMRQQMIERTKLLSEEKP